MNSRINVQEVRLIASNGDQVGVVETIKALELAKNEDLDLVEIVPNQKPPVCRIMDYGKYKFEQSKKAHSAKKKQKITNSGKSINLKRTDGSSIRYHATWLRDNALDPKTKDSEHSEDRPFTAIVEAFRFAFALGLSKGKRKSRGGEQMTVAPRQFTVADYIELVEDEARKGDDSLGAIISDYAEGGADMMHRYSKKNKSVLDMMN